MAKKKKTSDDRRKKLQELVEERNQDANSFFSGNENVTRENIGQKRKEDSNNFKKESAKRKNISSSSNQSNNYTYSSRNNDYELPMINNNENRFQLPTVNRPQMPTMNFQSRARRNSSFTGVNLNENSLKDKQKETSRKVFEALNPGKKLIFGNSQYFGKGNIDLNNRKVLRNEDGSISTEQSMSFGDENGNEILVPTIINGKKVSDDEAIKHYYKTGEYLGKFRTIEEAEKYAQELHNRQDKYYNNKETQNTLPTKENLSKIFKDVIKTETKGLVPYVLENYKQGLLEGTAGIGQGQILSASNEAKKISEKSDKDKLKDLNETMLRTLNPIYGITKKSFEIGQNTLDTLRNKDKTAKEKVADILTSGVSGVKDMNNPIGDVVKLSGKTAGIINNKAGDKLLELNEKIDKPLRENREKLQEEGQNYSNAVRMAGTVSNVVGNMTPSIVASRLGGGNEALSQALSLGTMGLSVKGRATQEALSKGAELDKAIKIGDTKAMTEVGTELLTGGLNIFGKGALDDIVKRGINRKVESKVLNYLAKQGAGIAGEVGEETISDILNTVIDQGTVDPNATYSMKDWSDTALTTMLSTVVLNALGGAYTPRAYNQNVQEMEQYKAKQDITERINNSNLSQEDKANMIDYIENKDFTQADYNAMREKIDNSNNKLSQEEISIDNNQKQEVINNQERLEYLKSIDTSNMGFIERGKIKTEIRALEQGYNSIEEYQEAEKLKREQAKKEYEQRQKEKENIESQKKAQLENDIKESTPMKNAQFEIIQNTNPMLDDYHTGIRSLKDIKTFDEVINDEESFVWGDFSKEDAKKALQEGKITIYSSYPIENGVFVSTSKVQAEDYAGGRGNKVYSKEVPLQEVAWINGDEGQYAKVENNTKKTKGESINWNEIERPEGKFRKHYQSIIQSSNTTAQAKTIAREMMGSDTYIPQSNKELLSKADARIGNTSPETELSSLLSKSINNEKVNDIDIAVGERLIEYYSKIGDSQKLLDAIHATAMAGTQAGRTVQAMAILNHMTPQGQVVWIQRSIDKANNELQQKYKNKEDIPQFTLTEDMINRVLETNSKEEMYNVLDDIYEELGEQVPKGLMEQIDEWRYFSMLANIKTHARNVIGNVAMGGVQRLKNKVAGAIEGSIAKVNPNIERTHTIKRASEEIKNFAKNDVNNMDVQTELGMNENKYNPQSRLQNARKTFKSDTLNNTLGKMFDFNSKMLEIEDNIGLKAAYINSLSNYLTANNIDVKNISDAQLQKARLHAINEAQEATFHQASSLATLLNQLGRKNNLGKFALDAVIPFKKTPINIAKTGIQYSPVGLVKSAVYDVAKVRNGTMTINKYIDNVSKGLTGTGIALMGYALAQAGILKASGDDDDKKESYDEEQGKQPYSLEVGGKSASLDWLSPVGIPLFIGAEISKQFNQTKKEKTSKSTDDDKILNQIINKIGDMGTAFSNAIQPMSEMSMISGLTNVLSSYNKDSAAGNMFANSVKSYINQFVPTALSQTARTTDKYERTTKSTKSGILPKAIDTTVNQIKSKIPGLRQTLPTKTNIWGKNVEQSQNLPFRAFNNFVNPAIVKDISSDKVDQELNKLYAETKEASIIPKSINKNFAIDGQDYVLTNKEYAKYNKMFGETAYNLIKGLVESSDYKKLTSKQKQEAIEKIYSYANEQYKNGYLKNNKIDYTESTLSSVVNSLNKKEQASYFNFLANTKDKTTATEKLNVLANANYTDSTKQKIYGNSLGKDDDTYSIMKNTGINISEYLKYKAQHFESDKEENGTLKGKSISGSKKDKISSYIYSMNINENQKLLLYAMQGYKTDNTQKNKLVEYVKGLDLDIKDKLELFGKFSGFEVYKNGTIKY